MTTETVSLCRRCGRVLLDPRSVALGLGPGCATGLRPVDLDHLAAVAAAATAQLTLEFGAA